MVKILTMTARVVGDNSVILGRCRGGLSENLFKILQVPDPTTRITNYSYVYMYMYMYIHTITPSGTYISLEIIMCTQVLGSANTASSTESVPQSKVG